MTPETFLDELHRLGVSLTVDASGELRYRARRGVLTLALRDGLCLFKADLVALLTRRQGDSAPGLSTNDVRAATPGTLVYWTGTTGERLAGPFAVARVWEGNGGGWFCELANGWRAPGEWLKAAEPASEQSETATVRR